MEWYRRLTRTRKRREKSSNCVCQSRRVVCIPLYTPDDHQEQRSLFLSLSLSLALCYKPDDDEERRGQDKQTTSTKTSDETNEMK
jgi:hypothetical protein